LRATENANRETGRKHEKPYLAEGTEFAEKGKRDDEEREDGSGKTAALGR
jgi:hypothetical protein